MQSAVLERSSREGPHEGPRVRKRRMAMSAIGAAKIIIDLLLLDKTFRHPRKVNDAQVGFDNSMPDLMCDSPSSHEACSRSLRTPKWSKKLSTRAMNMTETLAEEAATPNAIDNEVEEGSNTIYFDCSSLREISLQQYEPSVRHALMSLTGGDFRLLDSAFNEMPESSLRRSTDVEEPLSLTPSSPLFAVHALLQRAVDCENDVLLDHYVEAISVFNRKVLPCFGSFAKVCVPGSNVLSKQIRMLMSGSRSAFAHHSALR